VKLVAREQDPQRLSETGGTTLLRSWMPEGGNCAAATTTESNKTEGQIDSVACVNKPNISQAFFYIHFAGVFGAARRLLNRQRTPSPVSVASSVSGAHPFDVHSAVEFISQMPMRDAPAPTLFRGGYGCSCEDFYRSLCDVADAAAVAGRRGMRDLAERITRSRFFREQYLRDSVHSMTAVLTFPPPPP